MMSADKRRDTVERSVGNLVRDAAERYGDDLFVVGRGELTFADAETRSSRLAWALSGLGIAPGDTVALILENRAEFLVSWFAVAKLGAVEVPVNPDYHGSMLEYQLNHSKARVVIVAEQYLERILHIAPALSSLTYAVVVDDVAGSPQAHGPWTSLSYAALVDSGSSGSLPEVDPAVLMAVLYTSGTSGRPKGTMQTHTCAMHWAVNYVERMALSRGDTNYLYPPLFHIMSQFAGVLPALLTGSRLAPERFTASRFWENCRRHDVTLFNFTGGVLSFLWRQPQRPDDRQHTVRRALGSPIPGEFAREFVDRFGVDLVANYGSSEANVVCWATPGELRVNSSGRPIDAYDVRIVDEQGYALPPYERGEIVTRPRFPRSMMSGYFKDPTETAKAFRDLWFHTGDVGYFDDDGYLYFAGRLTDAIRRRGENVSCWELERLVTLFPGVSECAAVGVPSEHGEEEIKVVIVSSPDNGFDIDEFWAYCNRELPAFMVPRYVELVKHLPKTGTGRIRKGELRESAIQESVHDRSTWESDA